MERLWRDHAPHRWRPETIARRATATAPPPRATLRHPRPARDSDDVVQPRWRSIIVCDAVATLSGYGAVHCELVHHGHPGPLERQDERPFRNRIGQRR